MDTATGIDAAWMVYVARSWAWSSRQQCACPAGRSRGSTSVKPKEAPAHPCPEITFREIFALGPRWRSAPSRMGSCQPQTILKHIEPSLSAFAGMVRAASAALK